MQQTAVNCVMILAEQQLMARHISHCWFLRHYEIHGPLHAELNA